MVFVCITLGSSLRLVGVVFYTITMALGLWCRGVSHALRWRKLCSPAAAGKRGLDLLYQEINVTQRLIVVVRLNYSAHFAVFRSNNCIRLHEAMSPEPCLCKYTCSDVCVVSQSLI